MKYTLFAAFAAITIFGYWLRHINLKFLKENGYRVPQGFESAIDEEKLKKSVSYTFDSSRVGLYESIFDNILLILFLFLPLLPLYDRFITSLTDSFILSGILFFMILTITQTVLGLPFDIYETFVIEAKYGFNTTTAKIWITDFIKSEAISISLMSFLLTVMFWLVLNYPDSWWIWLWGFMAIFSLFMMFISPYIIEPLFNRYEPVKDEELAEKIRNLMKKAGLEAGKVLQMDASKRSKHSNAYFTGIGKVKRIVLYDTLIEQMSHEEIIAVLAHEIGHWKKGHIIKRLFWGEFIAFAISYSSFKILSWSDLPDLFEFSTDISFVAKMVLLGFIFTIASFPFTPISAWRSRVHENEADDFAVKITGSGEHLASALIRMSAENLSNLFPHPLYAKLYYSHPPVVERVNRLNNNFRKVLKHQNT